MSRSNKLFQTDNRNNNPPTNKTIKIGTAKIRVNSKMDTNIFFHNNNIIIIQINYKTGGGKFPNNQSENSNNRNMRNGLDHKNNTNTEVFKISKFYDKSVKIKKTET